MIQFDSHSSHVIKDKGERFLQEVVAKLRVVRQGFASEDRASCRISAHGEDIILSPEARQSYPSLSSAKHRRYMLSERHGNRYTVRQKSYVYLHNLNQWSLSRWMGKYLWWS